MICHVCLARGDLVASAGPVSEPEGSAAFWRLASESLEIDLSRVDLCDGVVNPVRDRAVRCPSCRLGQLVVRDAPSVEDDPAIQGPAYRVAFKLDGPAVQRTRVLSAVGDPCETWDTMVSAFRDSHYNTAFWQGSDGDDDGNSGCDDDDGDSGCDDDEGGCVCSAGGGCERCGDERCCGDERSGGDERCDGGECGGEEELTVLVRAKNSQGEAAELLTNLAPGCADSRDEFDAEARLFFDLARELAGSDSDDGRAYWQTEMEALVRRWGATWAEVRFLGACGDGVQRVSVGSRYGEVQFAIDPRQPSGRCASVVSETRFSEVCEGGDGGDAA